MARKKKYEDNGPKWTQEGKQQKWNATLDGDEGKTWEQKSPLELHTSCGNRRDIRLQKKMEILNERKISSNKQQGKQDTKQNNKKRIGANKTRKDGIENRFKNERRRKRRESTPPGKS